MELNTLLDNVTFLSIARNGDLQLSLGTKHRVARDIITCGVEQLAAYCEQHSETRVLTRLSYNLAHGSVEVICSYLQAIVPILPRTPVLELRFIIFGASDGEDPGTSSIELVEQAATLLKQHMVKVHICIEHVGMRCTAKAFSETTFCQVVCDKLSVSRELSFVDAKASRLSRLFSHFTF